MMIDQIERLIVESERATAKLVESQNYEDANAAKKKVRALIDFGVEKNQMPLVADRLGGLLGKGETFTPTDYYILWLGQRAIAAQPEWTRR